MKYASLIFASAILFLGAGCSSKTDTAAEARLKAQAEYDAAQQQAAAPSVPAPAPTASGPQDGTYCYLGFHCRKFLFGNMKVMQLTSGKAASERFEMSTHVLTKKSATEYTYVGALAGGSFSVKIVDRATLQITERTPDGKTMDAQTWKLE